MLYGMSQGKYWTWHLPLQLGGPRLLSLGGVSPASRWPAEVCSGKIALQGHCFTSPTPPLFGVLPPTPHPSLWGHFQGLFCSLCSSFQHFPFCVLNRGEFHFFCVSLLRPFVFKDAAGQMEGDLFAHLAQGSEKGTPWAREETSRNTVLPGRRPEDACNSRGQVTPSALASAPPSALPAHPWYWSVLF